MPNNTFNDTLNYLDDVYRSAYYLTHNNNEAEDLVQDIEHAEVYHHPDRTNRRELEKTHKFPWLPVEAKPVDERHPEHPCEKRRHVRCRALIDHETPRGERDSAVCPARGCARLCVGVTRSLRSS